MMSPFTENKIILEGLTNEELLDYAAACVLFFQYSPQMADVDVVSFSTKIVDSDEIDRIGRVSQKVAARLKIYDISRN